MPMTDPAARLVFRPLRHADRDDALRAHAELAEGGFSFLGAHWQPWRTWGDYLAALADERRGARLAPGRVPGDHLVSIADGGIAGMLSVRHTLNDQLEQCGGHIGYAVRPACRRRGYATALLRHGLRVARHAGVPDAVLITCRDDNTASTAVIETCGGRLDDLVVNPATGRRTRRYWIPV